MAIKITASGGSNQQAYTGKQYPIALYAQLLNDGAPVPGVLVTFRMPPSGPSALFQTGTITDTGYTDSSGIAYSSLFTANDIAGLITPSCEVVGHPEYDVPLYYETNLQRAAQILTKLSIEQGAPQNTYINTAFPTQLIVQGLDQYDSPYLPIGTHNITLTIPSTNNATFAGGVLSFVSSMNGLGEVFAPTITAGGVAGAFNITASVPPQSPSVPNLNIPMGSVNPAVATSWQLYDGNNQTTTVSTAFAKQLKVRLFNALGGAAAGASVTFTAPGSAASCRFPGSLTAITVAADGSGIASSGTATATASGGSYSVAASCAGLANINFSLQNGLIYLPEVCTAYAIPPGPNANSALGGVGTTPRAWTNIANACSAATSGNYASNTQPPPNSNRSQALVITPQHSDWLAIPNDAKLTKLVLYYWYWMATAGNGGGQLYTGFVRNGGLFSSVSSGSLIPDVWTNLTRTITLGAGWTGADLETAGNGFSFTFNPSSTFLNGACRINGVQAYVCYQAVDDPALREITVPLLFCEA